MQASLEAKGQVTVLEPFLKQIRHHQLSFADMQRWGARQPGQMIGKQGRRGSRPRPVPPQPAPSPAWTQLRLPIETRRDFGCFDRRRHADLTNPWLARARAVAQMTGEARGWSRWVTGFVDRALVILLSSHADGDKIRYSELFPVIRDRGLSVERTAGILDHLGLLEDDRIPAFESWLERSLCDLTQGIHDDLEHWLRTLHDGGPRSRPRSPETVRGYLREIRPTLLTWSEHYDHLRQVTRDDITSVADSLTGSQRQHTLSVLKSLFRHCRKNGTIFKDPAARIRIGETPLNLITPLRPGDVDDSVRAATTPLARLLLALAAVHAARTSEIRDLRLDDVDLGNRRLTIAGRARPLDELTRQMILNWLTYRHTRWPNTANPHMVINQQTAVEHGPASKVSITEAFRGQHATIERLRVSRQLNEAIAVGPDPLHLATLFGLDPKTAIRYADSARQLLITPAEDQDPFGSPRTQGQISSRKHEDP
jgi:site-specific recombinase XerD